MILLLFIYIAQDNHKESIYLLLSLLIFNFNEKKCNIEQVQETATPVEEPVIEIPSPEVEKHDDAEIEDNNISTRNNEKNEDPILYGFNFQSNALF